MAKGTYNLENDYNFFLKNKKEFCVDYPEKHLVIKDEEIIGVYDDQVSAFTETTKQHKPGSFIIQQCSEESKEAQIFRSRVVSL